MNHKPAPLFRFTDPEVAVPTGHKIRKPTPGDILEGIAKGRARIGRAEALRFLTPTGVVCVRPTKDLLRDWATMQVNVGDIGRLYCQNKTFRVALVKKPY